MNAGTELVRVQAEYEQLEEQVRLYTEALATMKADFKQAGRKSLLSRFISLRDSGPRGISSADLAAIQAKLQTAQDELSSLASQVQQKVLLTQQSLIRELRQKLKQASVQQCRQAAALTGLLTSS